MTMATENSHPPPPKKKNKQTKNTTPLLQKVNGRALNKVIEDSGFYSVNKISFVATHNIYYPRLHCMQEVKSK